MSWLTGDTAVKRGDRIAQLIIEKIATPEVVEVSTLPDTVRYVTCVAACLMVAR